MIEINREQLRETLLENLSKNKYVRLDCPDTVTHIKLHELDDEKAYDWKPESKGNRKLAIDCDSGQFPRRHENYESMLGDLELWLGERGQLDNIKIL